MADGTVADQGPALGATKSAPNTCHRKKSPVE